MANRLFRLALLLAVFSALLSMNAPAFGQGFPRMNRSEEQLVEQRANALVRLGRTEEAADLYLELLYKNPKNTNLFFRVSNLLPGKENASVLLQILDDILRDQQDNVRLVAERGRLLYLLEKKDEANAVWMDLLKGRPRDRNLYTIISNTMLQSGANTEAIALLEQGRVNLGEPDAFAFTLARIYAVSHDYDKASWEYLSHLDRNPGMLETISNQLIQLLPNEGAWQLTEKNLAELKGRSGNHAALTMAQAKLLLHQRRYEDCATAILSSDKDQSMDQVMGIAQDLMAEQAWEPAARLLVHVSSNSRDERLIGEALLNLARTYEHRLERQSSYHSIAGYFPGNQFLDLDVRLLDTGVLSLNRTLDLYDSLQTLLPQTREAYQASYQIAELHLMVSGDVDKAIQGFESIFQQGRQRDLRLMAGKRLVDAWLVKGDTTAALSTLEDLSRRANVDEDDPEMIAARIKIRVHQGDMPRLKKELLNLSGSASPADRIFNDGLEFMALLEGNGDEQNPALMQYLKAEKLVGQHKLSEAVRSLNEIKGDETTIADEAQVRAIQIHLALDDRENAVAAMDQFLNAFSDSPWIPTVLVWKAEHLQYVVKDPQAAIPYYEAVIVDHPDYLEVQTVRARLRSLIGGDS